MSWLEFFVGFELKSPAVRFDSLSPAALLDGCCIYLGDFHGVRSSG